MVSANRRNDLRSLVLCAVGMELSYLALHLARDDTARIALVLVAYAVGGVGLVWLLRRIRAGAWAQPTRGTWAVVFGAAVLFRLTLFPLPATTSGDVYRYLWEGLVQASGHSPYAVAPDDAALRSLAREHAALHAAVDHRAVPAIYPAFAQILFRINAVALGGTLLGWKLILLSFDMLLAAGVWVFLARRGAPRIGIAAVVWCPLLVLETYEGAHLDVVGVALLVTAVVAMSGGRWRLSAAAGALAVNVKYLWPGVVMLLLVAHAARRGRAAAFVAVAAAVTAACWLPFASDVGTALRTAMMFASDWGHNGPVFLLFRALPGPHWIPVLVVFALLVGLATVAARAGGDLWTGAWLLCGTALLLGPVAWPWYFVWLVPALAFRPPAWLWVWTTSVGALHLVGWRYFASGQQDQMLWLSVAITVVPCIGLVCAWRQMARGRSGATEAFVAPAARPGACA